MNQRRIRACNSLFTGLVNPKQPNSFFEFPIKQGLTEILRVLHSPENPANLPGRHQIGYDFAVIKKLKHLSQANLITFLQTISKKRILQHLPILSQQFLIVSQRLSPNM